MKIIGIAGGSGAGKSTASYALVDSNPDKFEVINIDDYQKLKTDPELPMIHGGINWDHPDIILWDKLIKDVRKLMSGEKVAIKVWAHRSNPDYAVHKKMIPRTIHPKPVLIVEGYLALYNPELNELYDRAYYFDVNEGVRKKRRDKSVGGDDYVAKVLVPMHKKYVEPTKANADEVIDVSDMTVDKIKDKILNDLV
jgi:uridine kinase